MDKHKQCPLHELLGPPQSVMLSVLDAETHKPMWITMKRDKAIRLGLLQPETTVLDDIIEAVDHA